MKSNLSGIRLTEEQTREMRARIADWFESERGETLGMIAQQEILDLFLQALAPTVYNNALREAERWYRNIQANMESDYYLLFKDENAGRN